MWTYPTIIAVTVVLFVGCQPDVHGVEKDPTHAIARVAAKEILSRHRRAIINVKTINETVDTIIGMLRPMLQQKANPITVADQSRSLGVGTISVSNIRVYNIFTIERANDLVIIVNNSSMTMSVRARMTLTDLILKANYKVQAFIVNLAGSLTAKIPKIFIDITFLINFTVPCINLTDLYLNKNNSMITIQFADSPEAGLLSTFAFAFTTLLGDVMVTVGQIPISDAIRNICNTTNTIIADVLKSFSG